MVKAISLVLVLLLNGRVLAQPPAGEDIFAYLARDGQAKGSDKALVTLIEFSDFQCSFCRRFWRATLPLIERKYIETGKVKFVYRHFAILGKHSVAAAQAAECAGEQGKFWPYHDKLFASAGWPFAFTQGRLKAYASELGLEAESYSQCLDSGKYLKKVDAETTIAVLLGARGTPAFFLNGQFIAGAQPFKVFEEAIEAELRKALLAEKEKP
ncbi:MAG: DsbA family protein [Candidatus Binatia bacterium]